VSLKTAPAPREPTASRSSTLRRTLTRKGRPTRQGARLARQRRRLASIDAGRLRRRYRLALAAVWVVVTALLSALLLSLASYTTAGAFLITTVIAVISLPVLARSAVPEWILQRTLRAGEQDPDLATDHLSRRLASLVQSTRILRIAIEASGAEDSDADREVWAWIAEVRELAAEERAVLEALGLSVGGVEAALLSEVEVRERADQEALAAVKDRRMEIIAEQLEGFETALLRHNPDPYR